MSGFSNLIDVSAFGRLKRVRSVEVSRLDYLRDFARALLVFAGYYVGSKIGFALTFSPYPVSTLWPPNSILLAALLLSTTKKWWFVILAAFPAHIAVQMQSNVPLAMQLCWFVSNTCEALIGAGLYRHYKKDQVQFDSIHDVTLFLICVSFFGPFLSSFLDAAFVILNGFGAEGYWHLWRMRFSSNVLAEFTLVPFIVVWSRVDISSFRNLPLKRIFESMVLATGLIIATIIVFNGSKAGDGGNPALLYIPLPFLLWAATRFGFRGLSTCILLVTFGSIWGAVHGHGPFTSADPVQNAFGNQLFLLVFSLPLIYLTAILQERKKEQEVAVENEERLRLALNAAQMSSWDWDLAEDLITWSDESNNIFGTKVKGRNLNLESFLSFLHPDDRFGVSNAFTRAIQDRSPYEIEYRIVTPTGKIQWVTSKGEVLFNASGHPIRLHGVNVDITQRKEAELVEREQRRELYLLSRVAVLGEFTGTLAHELNQPLAAIMSNTQAAQLFLSKDAKDEVRDALNDIIDQNNRAFDVVGRLRELLKKGENKRSPVDINEILKKVLTLTHGELIMRNIKVRTEISSNLPNVQGDPIQLEQVIMNLFLNAAEAMSAPEISDRKLIVTTLSNGGQAVELSVEDRGKGIDLEDVDRIFKPFFTTKEKGLGLGLAISRSIAIAHGGKLWVTNNQLEKGATFHLSLPSV